MTMSRRTLRITLLASEWKSSKGGLSTMNRELAIQLAKHPNVSVSFLVPRCCDEDKKVASNYNVEIVQAKERPGYEPVDWLTFPPKDLAIDFVVGHGVVLGKQAQIIKDSHHCKWLQVVHTAPDELAMYKNYSGAISKGNDKQWAELKLCKMADAVVAVGPKLMEFYSAYLNSCGKEIYNFTPGIFTELSSLKLSSQSGKKFRLLVFGRGDYEDFELKGYDIAAQAVAKLNDKSYHLTFVGAPSDSENHVSNELLKHGLVRSQLIVKGYLEDREYLTTLLCASNLVVIPSRTEGFGLTALEALSAGLPFLVSQNSGFGEALQGIGPSSIVDSEDPADWAEAIRGARQKGSETAIKECRELRTRYAEKYSWETQCNKLVELMTTLAHDQPLDNDLDNGTAQQIERENPAPVTTGEKTTHTRQRQTLRPKKKQSPRNESTASSSTETNNSEVRQHRKRKSSTSIAILVKNLDGLWQNQLPNFAMEQAFNIVSSQLEPRCSVCSFFLKSEEPSHADLLTHIRDNLHQPLSSLTADSQDVTGVQSVPRVPEICFVSDVPSPESMSSGIESPLLRCESCKLVVHASCYGVRDIPNDGRWKCQRCSQKDQRAIASSYCCLCRLGGGALKWTTDKRWAHVGCAVAIPGVFFVDLNLKEGINTSQMTLATKKLKCYYCQPALVNGGAWDNGACVKCCTEKCAISFHVTCSVLVGIGLKPSGQPQSIATYCEQHLREKCKGQQREFSVIQTGESVVAKHKNGRYYRGVVQSTSPEKYYEVFFDDRTYCDNLLSNDIVRHDGTMGDIPIWSVVQVKWGVEQELQRARITGRSQRYQVGFEDGSWLNIRREDIYKANKELPLKIQQRLGKQRDFSMIQTGESVVARHKNGRYHRGVVRNSFSQTFYEVFFDEGTTCDSLPPNHIVGYDSTRSDIHAGSVVQVKWGAEQELFTAKVTGQIINVSYQIEFEDESWRSVRREDVYKQTEELPLEVKQRLETQRDYSVIHAGESVVARYKNGRYYRGVVQNTSSNNYYDVSFDDELTYCDDLPSSDIVSHDGTRNLLPVGSVVQVKWGEEQELFTARITGRMISVTHQIKFEDESWLSLPREDVYKASEELPLEVQQQLGTQNDSSVIQPGESVVAKHTNGRYCRGVVQNTTEKYYEVSFKDGSFSDDVQSTDIVRHERHDIPIGSVVQIKWGVERELFTARITDRGEKYQINFEDDSCLSVRWKDVYKLTEELPLKVNQRLGTLRDLSVIHTGESIVSKHNNGRYYRGVVRSSSSEKYYQVNFDGGTFCDNLPSSDIVSHHSTGDLIPVGSDVQVKWGDEQELFKARITGRVITVTYQIEFQDDSWLSVPSDDVYRASEKLPPKVQQKLSSATCMANLSYWDDIIPDDSAKRPRKKSPRFT